MKNKNHRKNIKRMAALIMAVLLLWSSMLAVSATSGDGTADSPYLVTTAADLQGIKNDLSAHYLLTNNIDLSGIDSFAPIGNEVDGAFTGTINGAGYTVSYLTIAAEDDKYVGLVGYNEGTIKNLNIANADIKGGRYTGGIAGYNATDSVISGCTVSGLVEGTAVAMDAYSGGITGFNGGTVTDCSSSADVSAYEYNVNDGYSTIEYSGGIIGYADTEITVSNCANSGDITSDYIGGIIGYAGGKTVIKNCSNTGTIITTSVSSYDSAYSGGIAAYAKDITVIDCTNHGGMKINGFYTYAGGIVGYAINASLTSCVNKADLVVSTGKATNGGIIGYCTKGEFTDCINYGDIEAYSGNYSPNAGGIAASLGYAYHFVFNNCTNNGNITASGYYGISGGIAGYTNNSTVDVYNCVNNGDIYCGNYAGGIVGFEPSSGSVIENCVNTGDCHGAYSAGGIVGSGSPVISRCFNSGSNTNSYTNYFSSALGAIAYTVSNSFSVSNTDGNFCHTSSTSNTRNVSNNVSISDKGNFSRTVADNYFKNNYYWNQGEYSTNATSLTLEELKSITAQLNTTEEEIWVSDPMYNSGLPMLKNSPARLLLNESVLLLKSGETAQLKAYYDNAATTNVSFESLNTDTASVTSGGLITAKENGSACIAVRTPQGDRANCWVFVITESSTLTLPDQITAVRTQYTTLPLTLSETANEQIYWTSENTSIATIDQDGRIYGVKAGTVEITAYAPLSGLSDTCLVTVVNPPITSLSFYYSSSTVNVGTPTKPTLNVSPSPYTGTITYQSSDETVATVDSDGYILGIIPGTVVITATSDTGYTAQTTITVKQPSDSLTLNYSTYTLDIGLTLQLKATLTPENTTDTVTWTSDNSSIATVNSSGLVTAKTAGTTKITAKTTSGLTAYCFITVNKQTVNAESVTLNTSSVRLKVTEKQQLTATVTPTTTTDKTLTWRSSDENVVTVSDSGVIEGIAQGTATVTVSTANGIAAECVVAVVDYGTLSSAFSVGSASAKPNETVTVAVSVKENAGLAAFTHVLSYNSEYLTLNSVTPAEGLGGEFIADASVSGTATVSWFDLTDYTESGDLYLLEFTVSDTAPTGNIPLTLSFKDSDICNSEGETVLFLNISGSINVYKYAVGDINLDSLIGSKDMVLLTNYLNGISELTEEQLSLADINGDGTINVVDRAKLAKQLTTADYSGIKSENADGNPVLTIQNSEAIQGETVTVTAVISEKITAQSMLLSLEYDTSALTLSSASFGFGSGSVAKNVTEKGANLFWYSPSNKTASGDLLTLEFTVSDTAVSGEYPINIYCTHDNITNFLMETLPLNTEGGVLTVTEKTETEGDLNGDGLCNSLDLALMKKILLGKESADGINADIRPDGDINVIDLIALKKLVG